MSPRGRPEGEYRSAQHEGSPVSPDGRWPGRRGTWLLAALLLLQIALAVGLWSRGDRLAPAPVDTALIIGDLATVDRLAIDGPRRAADSAAAAPAVAASGIELRRSEGRWRLPGYHDAPADAAKVEALTDRLGRLLRGAPVATTPSAWPRFRVDAGVYERRLVAGAGDSTLVTLYLGTAPGVRKSHVRLDGDNPIYPAELTGADLPTDPTDWFDGRLLGRDTAGLRTVTLSQTGQPDFTLTRAAADAPWQTAGLPPGRALDPGRVKTLLELIGQVQATRVLGTAERPEWQQAAPLARLAFGDGAGALVTWTLSRPQGEAEALVLKASDRPWYVELTDWQARAAVDAIDGGRFVVDAAALAAAAAASAGASGAASAAASGAAAAAASGASPAPAGSASAATR